MDCWPPPACPVLYSERLKSFQCSRGLSYKQSQVTANGQLVKHRLRDWEYDTVLGKLSVTSLSPELTLPADQVYWHLVMSCML